MVKILNFRIESDSEDLLDFRVLDKVLLSSCWNLRNTPVIFPSLLRLRYFAPLPDNWPRLLTLLSPGLTELHLEAPAACFAPGWDAPLPLLAKHVPRLKEFHLISPAQQLLPFVHSLGKMLESLEHVTEVTLNATVATEPTVWKALSSLKTLHTLYNASLYDSSSVDSIPQPHFFDGGFPKLDYLILSLDHATITTLFSTAAPESLTAVRLSLCGVESVDDVVHCIAAVVSHCPKLLSFTLHHTATSVISLDHIRPLLSCRDLFTLRLVMPHDFSDNDVEKIALALPNLISLFLVPSPFQENYGDPTMTLKALLPLARRLKFLKHLALYMKTTDPPSDPVSDGYEPIKFTALNNLNFSFSRISSDDAFSTVLYLGDLCPDTTFVSSVLFRTDGLHHGSHSIANKERHEAASSEWDAVNNKLAILHRRYRNAQKQLEEDKRRKQDTTE